MSSIQRIAKASDPTWTKQGGRRIRTLRKEDNYLLPNDLEERARLKLQHDLMFLVWGRLFYAPLNQAATTVLLERGRADAARRPVPGPKFPLSIIDVACGDALWGYQIARQFPHARVVNLDIDATLFRALVEESPLPNNFEFLQADALAGPLLFPDGSFSFVHSRFPDTFLSSERFPSFLRELERVCRPDGWVEVVLSDLPEIEEPTKTVQRYYQAALEMPGRMGLCGAGGPRLAEYFEAADIKHFHHKSRVVGQQHKQKKLLVSNIFAALEGMQTYLDQLGLLPLAEFQRDWEQFRHDLSTHGYTLRFHRIWWQPDPRRQKLMWLPLKREPLSKPEEV